MTKSSSKSPNRSKTYSRKQNKRFLDPDPINDDQDEAQQETVTCTTASNHAVSKKKPPNSPIPLEPPSSSSVPKRINRSKSPSSNLKNKSSSTSLLPPSPSRSTSSTSLNPNLLSANTSSTSNKSPKKSTSRPTMAKGISISDRIFSREISAPAKRQTRAATRLMESESDSKDDEKGKGRMIDADERGSGGNGALQPSSGNVTDVTDVTQREASSMREAALLVPISQNGSIGSGSLAAQATEGKKNERPQDRSSSPLSELEEVVDEERERSESLDSQRSALLEELHVIHDETSQDSPRLRIDATPKPNSNVPAQEEEPVSRPSGEQRTGPSSSSHHPPSQVLAPPSSAIGEVTEAARHQDLPATSPQRSNPQLQSSHEAVVEKKGTSFDLPANPPQSEGPGRMETETDSKSNRTAHLPEAASSIQESTHTFRAADHQPSEDLNATPKGNSLTQNGSAGANSEVDTSTLGEASGSTLIGAGAGVGEIDVEMEDGEHLLADLDANVFSDLSSPVQGRNHSPSPLRKSPAKRRRLGEASPNASPSRVQQRRILQRTGSKANQALGEGSRTLPKQASPKPSEEEEFDAELEGVDLDPDDDLFSGFEDVDMDLHHSLSPTDNRAATRPISDAMPPPTLPGLTSGAGVPLRSSSPNSIKQAQDRISQTGSSPSGNRNGMQRSSSPLHSFPGISTAEKETLSSPGFNIGGDVSRPASRPSAAAMASARQTYSGSSSPLTVDEAEAGGSNDQESSKVEYAGFATAKGKRLQASEKSLKQAALQFSLIAAEVEQGIPTPSPKSRPPSFTGATSRLNSQGEEQQGADPTTLQTPRAGPQPDRSRTPFGVLPHVNVAGSPKSKSSGGANAPSKESLGDVSSFKPGGFSKASQVANLSTATVNPNLPPPSAISLATPKAVRAIGGGLRKTFVTPSRVGSGNSNSSFASGSKSQLGKRIPSTPANATPLRARPLLSSNKSIKFGSTPQNPGGLNRVGPPKFKTPFKNGVPPASMSTPRSLPRLSVPIHKSTPLVGRGPGLVKGEAQSVFDLTPRPRQSLSEYGIKPESVSIGEARFSGVSDDVFVILEDPSMAALYAFTDENDNDLGPIQALEMLSKAGAIHVNQKWVLNHWSLIIWKLAAITRHKPTEDEVWFTWSQVCKQLKYRYEREVNLAQRSAIQRIQEHDSSASVSMVLFVSAIIPYQKDLGDEDQADPPSSKDAQGLPELELSDGWYRIRCTIDESLARAVSKGKIKVGVKLAIIGARLNGGGEGKPVLDAYNSSFLSITGNSTSLARWDSRLGFVNTPFAATLRSLSADGGVITRMDVVLTRVYDHAWVDVNSRGGAGAVPRGDEEEEKLQREWEKKRQMELEKLQEEWSKTTRRAESLREMIENEAEGCREDYSLDLFAEAEKLLDKMKDLPSAAQLLRSTSKSRPSILPALVEASRRYCSDIHDEARSEIESGIHSLCPPRKVRDFRVVRFMDAHLALQLEKEIVQKEEELKKIKIEQVDGEDVQTESQPPIPAPASGSNTKVSPAKRKSGEKRPGARSVQLQVWDVNAFGKNALKVGGRYTVTNLVPTQKSSWRGPDEEADVMLSTRRDSRWRRNGEDVRIS